MSDITGRTRIYAILADPIAHVRTPQGLNRLMQQHGSDGVMVPLHVAADDLKTAVDALRRVRNLGGFVVTVPHKTAMRALCDEVTPAAARIGAVNVVRREPDGRLLGGMLDGEGFIAGLHEAGIGVAGRSVYLAGAGGAASAIAFALADAGVARLTLANRTAPKAHALVERLRAACPAVMVTLGTADPSGHDLVVNGTSLGLYPGDALPCDATQLTSQQTVAEIIMDPAETALLAAARARGCRTQPGAPMLAGQLTLMARFLGMTADAPSETLRP